MTRFDLLLPSRRCLLPAARLVPRCPAPVWLPFPKRLFGVVAAALLLGAMPAAAQAASGDTAAALSDSGPRQARRPVAPCVVLRIVDGDTLRCHVLGLVRLIGIDSPESNQPPFGDAATQALQALLAPGDTVALETDVQPRDRFGRTLAYVWHRGVMLNWSMLRNGWAVVLTYPPNVQYTDDFVSAQRLAREQQRGLWRVDGFRCLPVDRRRRVC